MVRNRPQASEVDWLLLYWAMFGCLCILENDLGWVASMAMTFRVDGDVLLGEALWHSDMKPGDWLSRQFLLSFN